MRLAGEHAQPQQTLFVLNLDPMTVSNSAKATEAWGQAYNFDVTRAAEIIIRSEPDLKLDPAMLLTVMFHMATTVRGALTGGQPADLPMAVRGDAEQALIYLRGVASQL